MGYSDEIAGKPVEEPGPDEGFAPLPDGWYEVTVIGADDKLTKAGDGAYINLRLEVEAPTHAGRQLWAIHLYRHPNETAERLGLAMLHGLARAAGRSTMPRDLLSWQGLRVEAKLKVKPASGGYDAGNEVKEYRALDRSVASPHSSGARVVSESRQPGATSRSNAPDLSEPPPHTDEDSFF